MVSHTINFFLQDVQIPGALGIVRPAQPPTRAPLGVAPPPGQYKAHNWHLGDSLWSALFYRDVVQGIHPMLNAGQVVGMSVLPAAAELGQGLPADPEVAPPLPGAVHPRCQAPKAPQGRGSRTMPPQIRTRSRYSSP